MDSEEGWLMPFSFAVKDLDLAPSNVHRLPHLSCHAVSCSAGYLRNVVRRCAVMFLQLVFVHERLGIICLAPVFMFGSSGVKVTGRFTYVKASLARGAQLALHLVVNTTTAAVPSCSFKKLIE